GNALAHLLGAPIDLFAGLGFVALFAGASNTPLACTIMGIELFGGANTVYLAEACFLAYLFSGHSSIYLSQRIGVPKTDHAFIPQDLSLRDLREIGRPNAATTLFDRLSRVGRPSNRTLIHSYKEQSMPSSHIVTSNDVGMVRIYMKPKDKIPSKGARNLWGARPLYRELVLAAKAAGLMNAVAHHTHYGYSNHGRVEQDGAEITNPELTMCVELVGHRGELEEFCRKHGAQLAGKVIIFKHIEHWSIDKKGDDLVEETLPTEEDEIALVEAV
ncbi:MAG TPA: DUF190 domain-containing protein, partial [Patescibacteria group bacterium]|nr:DUF190 domain-containing protein [Patescibacteria group bacterium]